MTCGRLVVFSGYSCFLYPQKNWPPRYNWNIVESGVKGIQAVRIEFFLYIKLPIFDVLYYLQLKLFIISYVNSLERRKYVAVWFSSIQSRLQCLPAQYWYIHTTYTVNSFGKTLAHVRNCLLKKKHMAQTKTLTDSTRKRHKKEDSASFV